MNDKLKRMISAYQTDKSPALVNLFQVADTFFLHSRKGEVPEMENIVHAEVVILATHLDTVLALYPEARFDTDALSYLRHRLDVLIQEMGEAQKP